MSKIQVCIKCENPTGRCAEDSIYIDELGPLCEDCYDEHKPKE